MRTHMTGTTAISELSTENHLLLFRHGSAADRQRPTVFH
jgi:hypothetical protein